MRNYVSFWTAVGLLSSVLAFAGYAHAGEQQTVKALSAWQGMGATFQVDEKEALVIGALGGVMFIDGAKGSLDAASLICPATVSINLVNGERDAEGRCIITDEDGDKVWAKWSCKGDAKGCKGPFKLVGGTGKFHGITGGDTFILRIALRELVGVSSPDSFQQVAAGLAIWPKLTYTIP